MSVDRDLIFRDADPSEDDELARVMYNAFLPIWNHNWFQCLKEPIQPVSSTSSPLTKRQARRLAFYRSWIALNRIHNGDITIAYTPPASQPGVTTPTESRPVINSPSPIAAVVLLLPPKARPSWFELQKAYRAGFLQSLFGLSGLTGVYRIAFTFEGNVHRLLGKGLRDRGMGNVKEDDLILVQGCVRNPEWEGRGPARKLLDWAIRRRWEREREMRKTAGKSSEVGEGEMGLELTPVYLDTTLDYAVRAYEEVGFKVLGSCELPTGADEGGIKLGKGAKRTTAADKQWVMLRLPE